MYVLEMLTINYENQKKNNYLVIIKIHFKV